MMLRAFGTLVGIVTIAFGVAVISGALIGAGPCRVNCDLYMSIIRLVGQAHYNRLIGGLWVIGGSMLIVALMLIGRREHPLRRGNERRGPG